MIFKPFKRLFQVALFLTAALTGCNRPDSSGELVGTRLNRLKENKTPYGMVLIPGGTFIMGQSDEDITFSQTSQNRQVTIAPFYMDETEISNSEYRQFVNWVRDSILIYNYLNDPSYFVNSQNGEARHIDWEKVRKNSPWNAKSQEQQDRLNNMYYQGEDKIFGKS